MANPANSVIQNLLPVQAYFSVDGVFQTFIGQGQPFTATISPSQSGLNITNSTINSTTIGATTPSSGVFTSIATTTGTISTQPTDANDIVNYLALQSYAVGISWKAPVTAATTANITLSGTQTIDSVAVIAGNTVLVKNQTTSSQNGIYTVNSGAWTYATGCTTWSQYVSALVFVEYGTTNAGSAWYCTAQPGGTLGTTAMAWSNFSAASNYTAGTGLTLAGFQFSITPVGTANTYGSASQVPVFTTNASGQVTAVTNTSIAIAATQITSGTIDTARLSGSYTGITGVGTLTAGTWNASTIGVAYGGTGAATFTAGYLKASGTTAFTTVTSIPSSDITGLGTMSTQNANNVAITGGTIATLTSPIGVPSGGTGAATLTGYVKGTGTAALTASSTIPSGDISGLGTMATQNANAVAITGGTVNGTTIGATTASTGAFTFISTSSSTSTTPTLSFNASNSPYAAGATISGSYLQHLLQNKSATAGASTNYVLSNDSGTDSTYYGEFGMNSSVFSASTPADFFSINNGVYFSGHDGDVSVGSGNGFKTYFAWGTTGQSAHVINASGALGLSTNLGTTPALSGTTGYGTAGQAVVSAGSASAVTWGVVGINGGGTNSTATATAGGVPYGTGTAYAFTAAGTTGQVLTSNGASAPTWATAGAATVTDDTTTNATRYPLFASITSGNLTTEYVSSTKLKFNPSTGYMTVTGLTSPTLTTPIVSTTMGVGGATPSGSGSGITFPASQAASTDANTLDDYEEGTWTPTDGSGAGLSFTSVTATYTKIGRFVFFSFTLTYPSTVSAADTRISGFPFNNIDNYEGKPGVCLVSGFPAGFITQKQGQGNGFIVNASNTNVSNASASTRLVIGTQYYETT
jgi:hypothetical protein